MNRFTRPGEQVQTQVNGAIFGGGVCFHPERLGRVNQPGFIVAADTDGAAGIFHFAEDDARHGLRVVFFRAGPQKRGVYAQVDRRRIAGQQRRRHHRGKGTPVVLEPGDNVPASGHRVEAAGIPEQGLGKNRADRCQLFDKGPGRLLGNQQVIIVRRQTTLVGAVTDAGAQAHADQVEKHGQFRLDQGKGAVVAGDYPAGRRQGVGFAHEGVGAGDGQFVDRVGMDHVPEIDDSADPVAPVAVWRDQHVVVVAVVVDHAGAKGGQPGCRFGQVAVQHAPDPVPLTVVIEVLQPGRNDLAAVRPVPVELPPGCRMIAILKGPVDTAHERSEAEQQIAVVGIDLGERFAGQVGEQAYEVAGAILPHDREDFPAAGVAADPGAGVEFIEQIPAPSGHMGHGQVLQFQHITGFRGIGYFKDETVSLLILQPKILVPFAG